MTCWTKSSEQFSLFLSFSSQLLLLSKVSLYLSLSSLSFDIRSFSIKFFVCGVHLFYVKIISFLKTDTFGRREDPGLVRNSGLYMSLAFPNLSWWLWSGKRKKGKLHNGSSLNSSGESNVLELDVLKFPVAGGGNVASDSRRVRRKWRSQEQGKIDKEYDVVLVPSDGGCFSDSESADDSDWSIGWSEPHAPGFLSEDEIDGGFGVLVPCYGRGHGGKRGSEKNRLGIVGSVSDYAAESRKYMEQWLSSLQAS